MLVAAAVMQLPAAAAAAAKLHVSENLTTAVDFTTQVTAVSRRSIPPGVPNAFVTICSAFLTCALKFLERQIHSCYW